MTRRRKLDRNTKISVDSNVCSFQRKFKLKSIVMPREKLFQRKIIFVYIKGSVTYSTL